MGEAEGAVGCFLCHSGLGASGANTAQEGISRIHAMQYSNAEVCDDGRPDVFKITERLE